MKTRSILRLGVAISVSIFSATSVEVAVGRRNRRVIRDGSRLSGPSGRRLSGGKEHVVQRTLGVGLENLKYGDRGEQYHVQEAGGKGKGQKGNYYSDSFRGKGKGYYPSQGKGKGYYPSQGNGKGKGYNDSDDMDYEKTRPPFPNEPPISSPTMIPKSSKPTNQNEENLYSRGKQTKQEKSEKIPSPYKPVLQPTRLPAGDKPTPSPSDMPMDESNKVPSSIDKMSSFTRYRILYTITSDERPPFRSELLEVVELTKTYVDRHFSSYYENSELTNLSRVMSVFTDVNFDFGEPIPIEYDSKAVFEASSVLLPDKEDLDNILVSAFEGNNLDGYIGLLQSLPPSNIFSSTQYAKLVLMVEGRSSQESVRTSRKSTAKNMTLSAIALGGAAGLILIFGCSKLLRRRTHHKNDRGVFGSKSSATIAGETFASHGSPQDDRMLRPICDELYNDTMESHR